MTTPESIRVLHVDDEPEVVELTAEMLHREDDRFTVQTATSPKEGLDRIADYEFECIVSDYDMPEMNGITFLERVREQYGNLPFILFTGKGSEEIASEAISAGVTDYLQKDTGTDQYTILTNRIANAVEQERAKQRLHERERELERQRERYRTLFENAPIVVWEEDFSELKERLDKLAAEVDDLEAHLEDDRETLLELADTIEINDVNEYAVKHYNAPSKEALIENLDRLATEQTFDAYKEECLALAAGETQITVETQAWTLDGELRDELLHVFIPEAEAGDYSRAYVTATDITERKRRQRELERQNDLFAKAQDIANVGAWAHDTESGTLTWTEQVYEMHGVSKEFEPSLEDVVQLYHPDDQPKLREAVDQAVTAGQPYDLEVRMTARGDTTRWIRTVADPQIENGDVVRVRGIVHDITERVEREQELRRYEHFFENSPDQIALLDEDFTVQYQSPPSSLYELDAIEIEGNNPLEYVHPDDRGTLSNHFEQLLENPGESFSAEFRAEDASGEWRWVESRARNLLDKEPADGILVMIRDITQQKRQQLRLERQNERLDEFASIISHDLQSPLSVAEGHLELAEETSESEHLKRASDAIKRSEALIDDLLTLAQQGDRVDETEPVDLAKIAEKSWQTTETQQATLETRGLQSIEADRSRLQQLLENLYRNAVEHGGEEITVHVGGMANGFYVADTGPGIPEGEREEIFEAGYSTSADGTGFGLRIVEQIADAHGWEITVTGSEQGGARFEITGVEPVER